MFSYMQSLCRDVFSDPANDGVDISEDDGDGSGVAERRPTSGKQTVQDISLCEWVAVVTLCNTNSDG